MITHFLEERVSKLQPALPTWFLYIRIYWHTAMPAHLCIIYSCFCNNNGVYLPMTETLWPTKLKIHVTL